jgi:hypothetical protein
VLPRGRALAALALGAAGADLARRAEGTLNNKERESAIEPRRIFKMEPPIVDFLKHDMKALCSHERNLD